MKSRNRETAPVFNGKKAVDKITRFKWSMVDSPGEFRFVPKNELHVDPDYQREESQKKVRMIASEWSWLACGVLLVAQREDETLYVYDGNHRVVAARNRSDIKTLPCLIFATNDVAEEAMGFLRANTHRKPVSMYDKFRALIITSDPTALLIDRLIRESGLRISRSGNVAKTVGCLSCLMIIGKAQPEILVQVWPLLVGLAEEEAFHEWVVSSIVYAQAKLITRGQSLMDRPWKQRVLNLGRRGVIEAAGRAAAFYTKGGPKVWASGLVETLNKGVKNRLDISGIPDEPTPLIQA